MDTQYKIARNIGFQLGLQKMGDDGEWYIVSFITKSAKVNGKPAKDCTDDELISDWQNHGRNWSLSRP